MRKVKVFDEEHELDLEDEVNAFLEELEGEVLDIQFQVALAYNGKEMEYCFSCFVFYEEDE